MGTPEFTHADEVAAELASKQAGVAELHQLLDKGLTRRRIRRRVESKHLHFIHPGVWAVGHPTLTDDGRRWAAVLASGEDAVLTHWSNAVHRGWLRGEGARIDVTVPTPKPRRLKGIHPHRAELGDHEIEIIDGLRCSSVARLLQELAATKGDTIIERVWREAVFHEALDLRAVAELLAERRGERGIRRLRELYRMRFEIVGRLNGFAEDVVLPLIRESWLPEPIANDEVEVPGRTLVVDFHFPDLHLVIEADSKLAHDDPEFAAEDAERDRLLESTGRRVHRVTHMEATRRPNAVISGLNALARP